MSPVTESQPVNDSRPDAETSVDPELQITTREIPQIHSLENGEWTHRPWPETASARGSGFEVLIRRSALNAIHRHGQASAGVEICGVVVGNVFRDDAGPYLLIETIIRGNYAGNSNANVTFTAETWNYIQGQMERLHPNDKIVGWYHTHPDHGIFLSEMDLFIHGHFFNMPWQVAFVYDPVSTEEGIFAWKDRKIDRSVFSVDEDAEKEIETAVVSPEVAAAALADFSRRMQAMQRRVRLISIGAVLILLLAIGWPFVLITIMGDPRAQHHLPVNLRPETPASTTQSAIETSRVPPHPASAPAIDTAALERALGAPLTPATNPTPATPPATQQMVKPVTVPEIIRPTTGRGGAKVLSGPSEGQP